MPSLDMFLFPGVTPGGEKSASHLTALKTLWKTPKLKILTELRKDLTNPAESPATAGVLTGMGWQPGNDVLTERGHTHQKFPSEAQSSHDIPVNVPKGATRRSGKAAEA